ncbi:MAG: hypothetical protein FJ272_04205 [Planctomycetes bacterium]|nr:hypothetical protein [Planctomycetota bacterium]MBM4083972.1 hypothetical protein [Planctomycetota bacterium]
MRLHACLHQIAPDCEARVTYTDNSHTMVSYRRSGRRIELRLHHMFQDAPEDVLEAIARNSIQRLTLDTRRRFNSLIRSYIHRNKDKIKPSTRNNGQHLTYGTVGRVYDLAKLGAQVNSDYFSDQVDVDITWSRRPNKRFMGTWRQASNGGRNLITINRLLDDERVPPCYLQYLVYHEMLHEVVPDEKRNGHTIKHSRRYREMERQFTRYQDAVEWAKHNVERLYRSQVRRRSVI